MGKRKKRGKGARKKAVSPFPWLFSTAVKILVLGAVLLGGYVAWLDLSLRAQFEGKRWAVPARIYARPLELYSGLRLSPADFEIELKAAGYQESRRLTRPGSYVHDRDEFHVATRSFRFWDGTEPAGRFVVRFTRGRVASIHDPRSPTSLVRLDPALIGRIYPSHREDRVLVRLGEVPELLVKALIAVEDRAFFDHAGISPRSIMRALLANVRAGAAVQGGSTLTQQLARNFFLNSERSIRRKLNEAIIALLLEIHYDKNEILEAYLNEIHLGQEGGRAIHGFGLAAYFYFGRPLHELRLSEMALLVALVRGASFYNPRRHPERALARRNLVLGIMVDQGVVPAEKASWARRQGLGVLSDVPKGNSRHPAFVDLVQRQLHRHYRDEDLRSEGLRIFSTLAPRVQGAAERTLADGIRRLAKRGSRGAARLQGAAVVTDTSTGEVLAVVGGREPRNFGFNRALDALRPVGSLVKPAVYLTALERPRKYTLVSEIDDAPLTIKGERGEAWSPQNYDGKYHGRVALHQALARSYNSATVRLGVDLGIPRVLGMIRRLGVTRRMSPYPSVLLGATPMTPMEVAQMYHTLANGGFRVPLRAIREVTNADGKPLSRHGLSVEQAVDPGPVFLVTNAMQETLRTGTGRGVYDSVQPSLALAGKTGTTNDLRDSWFAGFSGDKLAVVWLGLDDNKPTGLSGASGALPVWAKLMKSLRPKPISADAPGSIEWHWSLPGAAGITDDGCPGARRVPFLVGSHPEYIPCRSAKTLLDRVRRFFARPGDTG